MPLGGSKKRKRKLNLVESEDVEARPTKTTFVPPKDLDVPIDASIELDDDALQRFEIDVVRTVDAVTLDDVLNSVSNADDDAAPIDREEFLNALRQKNASNPIILEDEPTSNEAAAAAAVESTTTRSEDLPDDRPQFSSIPVAKDLYKEVPELTALSSEAVVALRSSLEIAVRGRKPPTPISRWAQAGVPRPLLESLVKNGFETPFAIQRQAVPAIMKGRDVIGVARTGSGKTLAYVVPLLRHVLAQPALSGRESGPIALVLAPSRELAFQIYTSIDRLIAETPLRATCVVGGTDLREQIGVMKSGVEVCVATPGRFIDLMSVNNHKLVSLAQCSFVVLDEADRMFDLGFEPQVTRILSRVRPDRQTVMFSATFPERVESLARQSLQFAPLEVVVGGRSKASTDVDQYVEVRARGSKFPRLLQLLGERQDDQVIVFVNSQKNADALYKRLLEVGYVDTGLLHAGVEQVDRDECLRDFQHRVKTVLVATSLAGRGLDVENLALVVNFDCPDHLEDYVHRVGRTGRAGRKGTAYTFVVPEDESRYAGDMVRALTDAKQAHHVEPELRALSASFRAKVKKGAETVYRNSGFTSSKGFTFGKGETSKLEALRDSVVPEQSKKATNASADDAVSERKYITKLVESVSSQWRSELKIEYGALLTSSSAVGVAASTSTFQVSASGQVSDEIEINHLPEYVRKKIAHKNTLAEIEHDCEVCCSIKGSYVPPEQLGNKRNTMRPLYMFVEGTTTIITERAVQHILRLVDELVAEKDPGAQDAHRRRPVGGVAMGGRY